MMNQVRTSQVRHPSLSAARRSARAFSLVEMLTVLAIIVIVLGILIPVLAQARTAARRAATLTVMAGLQTACQQFEFDKKRLPGYFSANDMGSNENATANGLTALENDLIDLAGGVVSGNEDAPNKIIKVGPTSKSEVVIDVNKMGATTQSATGTQNPGYYRPDPKYFAAQTGTNQRLTTTGHPNAVLMPVVIDAFGQPILAWQQNQAAGNSQFALQTSNAGTAQFYWAQNAGLLQATSLGKIAEDQNKSSILGGGIPNSANQIRTLEGLCGNPAFPATKANTTVGRVLPASPRGSIIFHSAGATGIYLNTASRGGKLSASAAIAAGGSGTFVPYGPGLTPPSTRDFITDGSFEDVILATGN